MMQRPTSENREEWKKYWADAQPREWFEVWGYWRTEPEIPEDRKFYLSARQTIQPDITNGIYPFRDVILTRADIEWLLANHEDNGVIGPIDWDDSTQRKRKRLDLRGARISNVDCSQLPLARIQGGLIFAEWITATQEQRENAAVHLDGASLFFAHLEGASFMAAHLELADLDSVICEETDLDSAHLEGADLRGATFNEKTYLYSIKLWSKTYGSACLGDIRWRNADLTLVDWSQLPNLGDWKEMHHRDDWDSDRAVVRAYNQLSTRLREQGISDDADRFVYLGKLSQRKFLYKQRKYGAALWSTFIDLLAGYGYRPRRSFIAYLGVILIFPTFRSLGSDNFRLLSFRYTKFARTLANPVVIATEQ